MDIFTTMITPYKKNGEIDYELAEKYVSVLPVLDPSFKFASEQYVDGLIPEIVELKNMVDFKFVVKRLVPRMMEELEGYKQLTKNDDGVPCMDSSFLFAYKDKLFSIEHYGSVIEVDDFCAIGSGAPEAMGSLFSTVNVDDPIKRIQDAIKSSATHDIYVDYPIVISSTENTEFKVFYEKDLAADQQCKTSK